MRYGALNLPCRRAFSEGQRHHFYICFFTEQILFFLSFISSYFKEMLDAFSSPAFHNTYVRLPRDDDPIPNEIATNPKFFPFFAGALGAIDGTHIACVPSAEERHLSCNRKGALSQNCLAACTFDLKFVYMLSGWEGSAADAALYNDARQTNFTIPIGKYYLADAGFAHCDELLVPYRGIRYHLSEWGRADVR
jgi:DDE superfamily endonuclease